MLPGVKKEESVDSEWENLFSQSVTNKVKPIETILRIVTPLASFGLFTE